MNYLLVFILLFIYANQQIPKDKKYNINHKRRRTTSFLECVNEAYDDTGSVTFVDLKIYLDTEYLLDQLSSHINYKEPLLKAMKKAAEILESFLKIYKGLNPKVKEDEEISKYVGKWNKTLVSKEVQDDYTMFDKGYSFVILFRLQEDMEETKIATSKILYLDECKNPLVGLISINPNKNYNAMPQEYLDTIMLHQFSHLLAFNYAVFTPIFEDNGCLERNIDDPLLLYLSSDKVVEYAKKYFGCDSLTRVEMVLDKEGINFHWSSRYLLGEYMADLSNIEEQVISGFTLALFEDLGYLQIKSSFTGGLMKFGKNQGCNFLDKKCLGDTESGNEIKFRNDFYSPKMNKLIVILKSQVVQVED